jgi:hypothetical protein
VIDSLQFPWDVGPPPPPAPSPDPEAPVARPKPRGRRPASLTRAAQTAPDWRYHHLTVSGPDEDVKTFAAAARGAGITPWQLDYAAMEEDIFVRAVTQPANRRSLTVAGCRILARQFREKVAAHQARAAALVGHSLACPFDLHVLLPVPEAILLLGPTHPTALAWLTAHWGILDRPRHVVALTTPTTGRRLARGHAVVGYGFFTDGETPGTVIIPLAQRWPALRFSLVPRPAD